MRILIAELRGFATDGTDALSSPDTDGRGWIYYELRIERFTKSGAIKCAVRILFLNTLERGAGILMSVEQGMHEEKYLLAIVHTLFIATY